MGAFYESDSPLWPVFHLAKNNPNPVQTGAFLAVSRPRFGRWEDRYGNWWGISATMQISKKTTIWSVASGIWRAGFDRKTRGCLCSAISSSATGRWRVEQAKERPMGQQNRSGAMGPLHRHYVIGRFRRGVPRLTHGVFESLCINRICSFDDTPAEHVAGVEKRVLLRGAHLG